MNRLKLIAILGLLLGSGTAYAQLTGFNGFCEKGATPATVSGLNSTNTLQGVVPGGNAGCLVQVYLTGTTTPAVIKANAGGGSLSNPFRANQNGQWLFFANTGQGYDVVMSGGLAPNAYTTPLTLTDLVVPVGGSGTPTVVEVNSVPISPSSPANFVDTASVTWAFVGGQIKATAAGGSSTCGPLSGDASSTNCGNGNFASYTPTVPANNQAYGFNNMANIGGTNRGFNLAIGNNSLAGTGGGNTGGDIIAIGDFAANPITPATTHDLIAIGNSPAENVSLGSAVCIGDAVCTPKDQTLANTLTGGTVVAIGEAALVNSTGNTAMSNIIAIGDCAGCDLNATSGTNTDLVIMGDGAGSDYTDAVHDIVALGNGAGSEQPSTYTPSTFAPVDLVAIGQGAGSENGGEDVVAIGQASAGRLATGSHDIVGVGNSDSNGAQTGSFPTTLYVVHDVVGIGDSSGNRNRGNEIIAIGDWSLGQTNCGAGFTGNTGDFNIAIGDHALAANSSGTHNVAIGYFSGSSGWTDCNPGDEGDSNTAGSQNTWIGDNTGPTSSALIDLTNTVAVGFNAGVSTLNQIAIGQNNLGGVTGRGSGHTNSIIGIGNNSVTNITNTNTNTDNLIGIGYQSLTGSDGFDLIVLGHQSGVNIPSTGTNEGAGQVSGDDILMGDGVGDGWTHPADNIIAMGNGVGDNIGGVVGQETDDMVLMGNGVGDGISGEDFYGIGVSVLNKVTGNDFVGMGLSDVNFYLTGSHDIVGIGNSNASGPLNGSANPVAAVHNVVSFGQNNSFCSAGNETISIGHGIFQAITAADVPPCTGLTGAENIGIGDHPLAALTTGTNNIAIGYFVGSNGYVDAVPFATPTIGNSNQTGSRNTWIGDTSGPISTTQLSNTVALGYGANPTVSNQTVIGNSSITAVTIFGVGTGCLSSSAGVITGSGSSCGSGGGGASTVTVNGGSALTTANFGSLPAAGTNGINVTWQNSGANVSAEVVGDGNTSHFLRGDGTFATPSGSAPVFSAITSGTNTIAAMVCGSGCTINFASAGTINASSVGGVALSGLCQTGGAGCPQLAVTKAAVSHQFFTSYTSGTGLFTSAQPAFTDISGQTTLAQFPNASANSVLVGSGVSGAGTHYTEITLGSGLSMAGTVLSATGGGSLAFSSITSATNTTAAMLVGTGASLGPTGTGTIQATNISNTISAGTNMSITGSGTTASPYVLNASGSAGTAWSALSNPTGNLALTMGADTSTFTYNATTGSSDMWKITDTASNTGTGILLHITTASSSTEIPWQADANGCGWQVTATGLLKGVGTCSNQHGVVLPASSGGLPAPIASTAQIFTDSSGNLSASEAGVSAGAFSRICTVANALCGGGGGSVSITSSTGDLTVSPSPLTGTGTIDLNLAHANTWTANQTAPSFIASGSGAGSVVLTQGTAPGAVANSVQLIAPATVTTGYNFVFPAGAPGVSTNQLVQCSGTTLATCSFTTGTFTTQLVTGTYSDFSFNGVHTSTTHIGIEADASGTDKNIYVDVPTGGTSIFRVNGATSTTLGFIPASTYGAISFNQTLSGSFLGMTGDSTGGDPNLYFSAPTGGNIIAKVNNVTIVTFSAGNAPTGACGAVLQFVISAGDGKGTYCNGSTWTSKF